MKNKILLIIPALLLIICSIVLLSFNSSIKKTDSYKFKKEYEALNNKKDEYGEKYKKVNISINNPIIYSNYDEIFDILNNKTGVIYLGTPTSNDSREIINALFKVLKDNKINKLYYLDITNDKDYYTIEDNKLVYSKDQDGNKLKGTEEYKKMLSILDKYLPEYIIEFDGTTFNTSEKRIYEPTIIFVKDGKIVGVEYLIDKNNSYDIYNSNIEKMNKTTCNIGEEC